ncbi:HEAT repeat domain-containing protein [Shimia sp. Alg240-R146]|uniref:HEAT repeat domain-containing protein n=1 Tax=Shimia sp. Alg240-R146 TaxID=2993449 RepID=UPI0022E496AD|nr:HEAT repeat domain-containing protein [Shimia sp. Alg240-R146]
MTELQDAVREAAFSEDADAFEVALAACVQADQLDGLCDILTEALSQDWHFRHEDVARAIQQLRCPSAVAALEARALNCPSYLEWDDDFALARKCSWALADIGTPEARAALERLSRCDIPKVRGFAAKRLAPTKQQVWPKYAENKRPKRNKRSDNLLIFGVAVIALTCFEFFLQAKQWSGWKNSCPPDGRTFSDAEIVASAKSYMARVNDQDGFDWQTAELTRAPINLLNGDEDGIQMAKFTVQPFEKVESVTVTLKDNCIVDFAWWVPEQ